MKISILFVLCCSLVFQLDCLLAQKTYTKVVRLMGSRFEITAVSEHKEIALGAIHAAIAEITRIEKLISSWDANSQTSDVNRNAGLQPVKVSSELFDLIARGSKVSRLTDGAFDISFAAMDKIWQFDRTERTLPSEIEVEKSVAKVNYHNIILDRQKHTVFLKESGMKIGFGAIGKGYAANKAKEVMMTQGIRSGMVNAGGDLIAWGKPGNGDVWQIAVADPQNRDTIFAWLDITDMAVVTSGDYEKFFMSNGKRYGHIIDPRTGYPATGLKSVTVVCPDAELADALATAVFVLGEQKGLGLIDKLNGIEALVINDQNKIKSSQNLHLSFYRTKSAQNALTIGAKHEN